MKPDSVSSFVSRRAFCANSAAAAGLAFFMPRNAAGQSVFSVPGLADFFGRGARECDASIGGAYSFLNTMMDAYASGATVRLIQSYSDQLFGPGRSVAFTYDNAVVIHAYLARGTSEDLARAQILGNGLLEAQNTNFPFNDGRFGQAYYVNTPDANKAYITPCADPFYFYTSAVGDQAWAGMALAKLYKITKNPAYLAAAIKTANWIVANAFDAAGLGGYLFGTNINQFNQSVPSGNGKSTEHNIDTFAFFTMLAQLTNNAKSAANGASWSSNANHALLFVQSTFNATGGFFYTGTTGPASTTIFKDNLPEDVQTWSYLALQNKAFGVSLDWVKTNLAVTDTPLCPNSALAGLGKIRIQGLTYASASLTSAGNDEHAVWLEGTAQGAAALLQRRLSPENDLSTFDGDLATARTLLENIRLAQSKLGAGQKINGVAIAPGQGITASTGNLDTGFGFSYFPALHIGATGWFAIAMLAGNPFQLNHRQGW